MKAKASHVFLPFFLCPARRLFLRNRSLRSLSRHTGRRRYFIGSAAWRRVFALCGNEGRLRRHLRVLFRGWGGHFAVPEMRASVHGTELSVQGASEVEIYSMNGSLLLKKTVSPAGVSISLDGLNAELCIVKITGGTRVRTQRIVAY